MKRVRPPRRSFTPSKGQTVISTLALHLVRFAAIAAVALATACAAPTRLVASTADVRDCKDTSADDDGSALSMSAVRGEYDELRLPVPSGNPLLRQRRCEPRRDVDASQRVAGLR